MRCLSVESLLCPVLFYFISGEHISAWMMSAPRFIFHRSSLSVFWLAERAPASSPLSGQETCDEVKPRSSISWSQLKTKGLFSARIRWTRAAVCTQRGNLFSVNDVLGVFCGWFFFPPRFLPRNSLFLLETKQKPTSQRQIRAILDHH